MDRTKGVLMQPPFSVDRRRTLQLAPLWLLSALTGRTVDFMAEDLAAFWDALVDVTLRTPQGSARDLLVSLTADRSGLLLDLELDDRSVTTGLRHVVAALGDLDAAAAADYKVALLRIGSAVARARGPYGRTITPKDTSLLLLIASLLDMSTGADGPGVGALSPSTPAPGSAG